MLTWHIIQHENKTDTPNKNDKPNKNEGKLVLINLLILCYNLKFNKLNYVFFPQIN